MVAIMACQRYACVAPTDQARKRFIKNITELQNKNVTPCASKVREYLRVSSDRVLDSKSTSSKKIMVSTRLATPFYNLTAS